MYNVLIADDEDIIRQGFIEFVPWEELGFKVVFTCDNGDEVIDYISKNHVDFILTDIIMIGATGLDIAKYVYENSLPAIVCLISGHRNFEYARSAMKYNVKYYLTKPTEVDDILSLVKEVREHLDKSLRYPENPEAARAQFFYEIFMGNRKSRADVDAAAAELKLNAAELFICPFWITVNNFDSYVEEKWNYGKELLFTALLNFLRDNLKQFGIYSIMINGSECLYLAVCSGGGDELDELFRRELDASRESIMCLMDLGITYQIGHTFYNIYDFCEYFSNNISRAEQDIPGKGRLMLMELYKNVVFSLILGNHERIDAVFHSISASFAALDGNALKAAMLELMNIIYDKLKNAVSKDFGVLHADYTSKISSAKSNDAILDFSHEFLIAVSENINAKSSPSEMIIEKAKEYIAEHYADNISLYDVANYVFLNASYLSRLFKQYTGENFRDYLISIRITKAAELIKQNKYKIYEISELCGYKNPKYFAQQFKQVTGLSPTEYLSQTTEQTVE